eukprot:2910771-Pyramimonas_sp.AAC.3
MALLLLGQRVALKKSSRDIECNSEWGLTEHGHPHRTRICRSRVCFVYAYTSMRDSGLHIIIISMLIIK